jgi:hypothetical protein
MDNFNYKKYTLENLSTWIHDVIYCDQITADEIFDEIVKIVKEECEVHEKYIAKCKKLLNFLQHENEIDVDAAGNYIMFNDDNMTNNLSCSLFDDFIVSDINYSKNMWEDFIMPETSNDTFTVPVEVDGPSGECYITIPDELLEKLSWKEGDELEFIHNNESFIIKKV